MNRRLNKLTILMLCFLVLFALAGHNSPQPASAADEFDSVRQNWFDVLTGGASINTSDPDIAAQINTLDSEVQNGSTGVWDTLQTGSNRTACDCLWTDLTGTTLSGNNVIAYGRIRTMALAFTTTGSSLNGNASLQSAILDALDWMYANRYNENTTRYGNWYHWEISAPENLLDATVLMYPYLSTTQLTNYMNAVNYFAPDPNVTNGSAATGANRVEKSWVVMLRGVLIKDGSRISLARDALSDNTGTSTSTGGVNNVFAYVTVSGGDGMHTDGSFLQHGPHPYIGNYGTTFLQLLANTVYLLNGTSWTVTDPQLSNMFKWVYDSFDPTLYKGGQMDMIRGRLISNSTIQSHDAGQRAIQGVLTVSTFAPTADAAAFKSMVKYWVTADTFHNFMTNAPIYFVTLAKAIVNDSSITSRGDLVENKIYTQSDRIVHQRPGFAFGISMSSSRVYRYESINSNNLHGWRMGDGVTYVYNDDLAQYDEDYWPTVDMYHLPGITTDEQTLANSAGQSTKTPYNWVGGVSDGEYGVAGMQFNPYNSSLTGKKSWFLFDNEIVALGSGITSTDSRTIETIVDNRKLKADGSNVLTVNGTAQPTSLTLGTQTYTGVNWAQLEGNTASSGIGYYFPTATSLKGLREARTGTWGDIQGGTPTDPITKNYQSIWFDHGVNPTNSSYAYAILPNVSSAQTGSYAANPQFVVLENSTAAQAVKETTLNLVGANFWNDGTKTIQVGGANWLTSDAKASVMTKESTDSLDISVSDPTEARSGTIDIEVQKAATGVISLDPGITVTQLSPSVKLSVDVSGAEGRSFNIKLSLNNPADSTPPSAPAGLTAAPQSLSKIRLDWSPSTDNVGVAGYRVYRNGTQIATVLSPGYTDSGLNAGTAYSYKVQAYDPAGNISADSSTINGSTFSVNDVLFIDTFDTDTTGNAPSGYTIDPSGGTATVAEVPYSFDKSVQFTDNNSSQAVSATKTFTAQTEPIAAQFDIMLPTASNYHSWSLKDGSGNNAVTVMTSSGNLIYKNSSGGDSVLQAYSANTWYTIKIVADPSTDTCTIYVNGVARATDVAFRNAVSSISVFAASSGVSSTGTFYLNNVSVAPFANLISDTFDSQTTGAAPAGYTIDSSGGTVTIDSTPSTSDKSVKFNDTNGSQAASATKTFAAQTGPVSAQFDIMLPASSNYHNWDLKDSAGTNAVTVMTSGGNLIYKNSTGGDSVLQAYSANTWYTIQIVADPATDTSTIYVNGIARATDVGFRSAVTAISSFAASTGVSSTGTFYLNNVNVVPYANLINDTFDAETAGAAPSGYTVDTTGGTATIADVPSTSDKSVKMDDTNASQAVSATKSFTAQTGRVIAEFDVMLPAASDYHNWSLKNDSGTSAVTVMTSGGNLIYKNSSGGDSVLQAYSANTWYSIQIIAGPSTHLCTIYVNGVAKASNVGFRNPVSCISGFAASSGMSGTGTSYFDNVKIYK